MKKYLVLAALLATALGVVVSAPARAAPRKACLQNNRIWSWNVVDERTMIVSDVQHHRYLVRLSGGCTGLDNARLSIAFKTWTNLGCLGSGDKVTYREPALGRMSCSVRTVEPYRGAARDDFDRYHREGVADHDH